jgi:predicted membrane protein
MCFIVAMIGLVMSYNFFIADMLLASIGSFSVAIIFIYLMIKNIIFVKKHKRNKKEGKNDS